MWSQMNKMKFPIFACVCGNSLQSFKLLLKLDIFPGKRFNIIQNHLQGSRVLVYDKNLVIFCLIFGPKKRCVICVFLCWILCLKMNPAHLMLLFFFYKIMIGSVFVLKYKLFFQHKSQGILKYCLWLIEERLYIKKPIIYSNLFSNVFFVYY